MLRADIAKRISVRIRDVKKLAYEPEEGPGCPGLSNEGCPHENPEGDVGVGYLCEDCVSQLGLAAMEQLLPWEEMEKAPEIYKLWDKRFSDEQSRTHQKSGIVKDWNKFPEVQENYKQISDRIMSEISGIK